MEKLRPYQRPSTEEIDASLMRHGAALDASDTGTGKTYKACELIRRYGLPTLVIAPKVGLTMWHRVAEYMGTSLDAINLELLRYGRTPYGTWVNEGGKVRWRWAKEIGFLVIDEVHRCAGIESQAANMLYHSRTDKIPTLMMSATPAQSPLEMHAIGHVLGLHKGGQDFWQWARNHGCRKDKSGEFGFYGWPGKKPDAIMEELHRKLFPAYGTRIRKADIPGFPKTQILAELYDVEQPGLVDALYARMEEAIKELHDRTSRYRQSPSSKLLAAQQEVELLKVPILVELANDAVDRGCSVPIFVNFRATMRELLTRLNTPCAIYGAQDSRERQGFIDGYQMGFFRHIVCQAQAGGVLISLHDLDGCYPREALICPGWCARTMHQIFGRVHRDDAKTPSIQRIILAAGTCEEKIHAACSRKAENMYALVDGDLRPEFASAPNLYEVDLDAIVSRQE